MKKVEGYLAEDGNFFVNEEDAELHEAEMVLSTKLGLDGIKTEAFIELVNRHLHTVERYINARKAHEARLVSVNTSDKSGAKENPASLLK